MGGRALSEHSGERGLLRVIDLCVALAQECSRAPGSPGRKAQDGDPVEHLERALIAPARHHGIDLESTPDQLAANDTGGPPVAAVLAPGKDLHADEADSHGGDLLFSPSPLAAAPHSPTRSKTRHSSELCRSRAGR